jgi:hydrogenase maturation protease
MVYGYGNPGRQDDGLGNEMINKLESWQKEEKPTNLFLDSNYQLNIEDASNISDKDIVIFVDASVEKAVRDFTFSVVQPTSKSNFSMHAVSPGYVLDLCNKIYHHYPSAYLLHIKGYEWEFMEGLTAKANKNLEKAFYFLKKIIKDPALLHITSNYIATQN